MEAVNLFEKIWVTDIIYQTEPLYSISIAVTEEWKNSDKSLEKKLLERLQEKWFKILTEYISSNYYETKHSIHRPSYNEFKIEVIKSLKEHNKDHPYLLETINKFESSNVK